MEVKVDAVLKGFRTDEHRNKSAIRKSIDNVPKVRKLRVCHLLLDRFDSVLPSCIRFGCLEVDELRHNAPPSKLSEPIQLHNRSGQF